MSKTTNFLDVLFLDGFSWTDLVDMLEVPHYTNEHRGLVAPRMYEIRSVKMPDLDDKPMSPITKIAISPTLQNAESPLAFQEIADLGWELCCIHAAMLRPCPRGLTVAQPIPL